MEADCPHALRSSVKNHFSDLGQEEHREAARPSKSSSRQPLHLKLARATKGLGRPAGVSRKPTAASGSTHIHIKNSQHSVPKYRPLSTPVVPSEIPRGGWTPQSAARHGEPSAFFGSTQVGSFPAETHLDAPLTHGEQGDPHIQDKSINKHKKLPTFTTFYSIPPSSRHSDTFLPIITCVQSSIHLDKRFTIPL